MESESKNIIQMFDRSNKLLMSLNKEDYSLQKDEELKDIGITYHNVCEIYKQLQTKEKEISKQENNINNINIYRRN